MSEAINMMLDGVKRKDPIWMVELGLLYCGEANSYALEKHPELREFCGQNPEEGFKLIAEGIVLVESQHPIAAIYDFYKRILQVFMAEKNSVRSGEKKVTDEQFLMLLEGQVMYSEKALTSLQAIDNAPKELIEAFEGLAKGSKTELEAARERIRLQGGLQNDLPTT